MTLQTNAVVYTDEANNYIIRIKKKNHIQLIPSSLFQRGILLCQTCDPESGQDGVRSEIHLHTGQEENVSCERNEPAFQA